MWRGSTTSATNGQQLKALLLQSLERVRRGARLEGVAAQDGGARLCHRLCRGEELLSRFDGTGPGDRRKMPAADQYATTDIDDRVLLLKVPADELERLQHRNRSLDPGKGLPGKLLNRRCGPRLQYP